jgi:hypothetical protein
MYEYIFVYIVLPLIMIIKIILSRVNFPHNKILGGKFTRTISLSKTLRQKTSKFNPVIFMDAGYSEWLFPES